jgi:hypothetical protein
VLQSLERASNQKNWHPWASFELATLRLTVAASIFASECDDARVLIFRASTGDNGVYQYFAWCFLKYCELRVPHSYGAKNMPPDVHSNLLFGRPCRVVEITVRTRDVLKLIGRDKRMPSHPE